MYVDKNDFYDIVSKTTSITNGESIHLKFGKYAIEAIGKGAPNAIYSLCTLSNARDYTADKTIILDGKTLGRAIKGFGKNPSKTIYLSFTKSGETQEVLELSRYNTKIQIPFLAASGEEEDPFKMPPIQGSLTIDGFEFRNAFSSLQKFVGGDNGTLQIAIHNDIKNKNVRMVSTDGHRMMVKTINAACDETPPFGDKEGYLYIIPSMFNRYVKGLSGDHIIVGFAGESLVTIGNESTELYIAKSDASFPPYQAVIPKSAKDDVLIKTGRMSLINALKQLPLSSEVTRYSQIIMEFEHNKCRIFREDENMACESKIAYTSPSNNVESGFKISFNAKYLISILEDLKTDNILIVMKDSEAGITVTEEADTKVLLMPIKIV